MTTGGIKADPSALGAAQNQYSALADMLDSSNQVVGGAAFTQNSALWGGVGASQFGILSNAISATYVRATAGMRAAATATGELRIVLEELVVLWNAADAQFKQWKLDLTTTQAEYAATQAEYTLASAQLAIEQAAMAAYQSQVAVGAGVLVHAPTPPSQTPGLQAKVDELHHKLITLKTKMTHQEAEMERLSKAMLQLEERASTASGQYGVVMSQIEGQWPSPVELAQQQPSGGGGFSLGGLISGVIDYGTPVGLVGKATGLFDAGKITTTFLNGAVHVPINLARVVHGEWDMWFGNPNSSDGQLADGATEALRHPGQIVSNLLPHGDLAYWAGGTVASFALGGAAAKLAGGADANVTNRIVSEASAAAGPADVVGAAAPGPANAVGLTQDVGQLFPISGTDSQALAQAAKNYEKYFGSSQVIRTNMKALLTGRMDTGLGSSQGYFLHNAMIEAPAGAPELYRGTTSALDPSAVVSKFTAGSELKLPPSSYSSNPSIADQYANLSPGAPGRAAGATSVVFRVAPGSQGLDLTAAGARNDQSEWLAGGKYQVVESRVSGHVVYVDLQQTGGYLSLARHAGAP